MPVDAEQVPFSARPEWKDVTPIPQNEPGMSPIAQIFYTPAYKDATDYFRGLVKMGEMSERALELTEAVIRLNPANYSAWQYRYQTLLKLDKSLDAELELMDEIATLHLKTYQVWHHRRLLLTRLRANYTSGTLSPNGQPKPSPLSYARRELTFIASGLGQDAKNYHTWSYRQWVLTQFAGSSLKVDGQGEGDGDDAGERMWAEELTFIDKLLEDDVRNNSAWHHRFFVVFSRGGPAVDGNAEEKEEILKRELGYAKDKIALAPNNASAWNYLRGVLDFTQTPYSTLAAFVKPFTVESPSKSDAASAEAAAQEQVIDLDNPSPSPGSELPAAAALEFQADIYEKEVEGAESEKAKKAIEIWQSLAEKHDPTRKQYWEYRIHEVSASA